MNENDRAHRCAVLVGPQGSGKTTLLSALISRSGAAAPAFDTPPEAKEFAMTTEPNFARCDYHGETWNFIDCPGSIELIQQSFEAMRCADIVVIVAEPNAERGAGLGPYFRFLDALNIPHVLFVNRMGETHIRVRDLLQALQSHTQRPLVLRQVPMRDGDNVVGAIDLVSERAWKYREGQQSELIQIPEDAQARKDEAREEMLDVMADFDEELMEQILEDKVPPSEMLFNLMAQELQQDFFAPVLLGSAAHGHGITRLFKLLRHEAPEPSVAAKRYGLGGKGKTSASIIRTMHVPHAGKISVARIWEGTLKDGEPINGSRLSGMFAINGDSRNKQGQAIAGDIVGLPRLDALSTGDIIIDGKIRSGDQNRAAPSPVYSLAIRAKNDKDDVKLSTALSKLYDEDASLGTERRADTAELVLHGQGDIHLRLAAAKLKNRYNVEIVTATPNPSFRETIRSNTDHHTRHKKQSGGHGQFADIKIKIKPRARGEGYKYDEVIHGGTVPKQFIPAVDAGVQEELKKGPLGFPVVDLAVTLCDGLHHPVDSNEMSFKLAGRQAMREALPECDPVLLEPIHHTAIHTPREYTNKVHGVISGRRGQILGFDAREDWPGWDTITAMMPESALQDLIIEIRSLSQGSATFSADFDHYQELFGKDAEKIIKERKAALEQ